MTHILSAFDEDFAAINRLLAQLGGLAESQLAAVMSSIENRQLDQLDALIARDHDLDALEAALNEQAINLIALRAPMAQDLRRIIAVLKIAAALERVGDYAKNIAKRSKVILPQIQPNAPLNRIVDLSRLVQTMLREVMDACLTMDAEKAARVVESDIEVDQLHTALFKELIDMIRENPEEAAAGSHLLFIAKNIERMGDFATNISEQIQFLVFGEVPDGERPKADQSSLL